MIYFFKKLQKKAYLKIFLFISCCFYSQLVFANLQPLLKSNHQQNITNNYNQKPLIATANPAIYQIMQAIALNSQQLILINGGSNSEHNQKFNNNDLEKLSQVKIFYYIDDKIDYNLSKLVKNFPDLMVFKVADLAAIKIIEGDSHLWLNPENAIIVASDVAEKLTSLDPDNKPYYQNRSSNFKKQTIANIDFINNLFARKESSKNKNYQHSYLFYHNGYSYFEKYFHLNPVMSMLYDDDKEISIADLKKFNLLIKQNKIRCLFGDMHSEKSSAKKLAENNNIKFLQIELWKNQNRDHLNQEGYNDSIRKLAIAINDCIE